MVQERRDLRGRHERGGPDRRRHEAPRLGRIHRGAYGETGGPAQERPGAADPLPGQKGGPGSRQGGRRGTPGPCPSPSPADATGAATGPGGGPGRAAVESHAGCGGRRAPGAGRNSRPEPGESYDVLFEPGERGPVPHIHRGARQLRGRHRRRRHHQSHGRASRPS